LNFRNKPLKAIEQSPRAQPDRFVVDIALLLLTFFAVVVIDMLFVSLITHRLRFWFPQWLDPQWASRSDPWVVYSQSYFAGIFMIPVLCRLIDREFLVSSGGGPRTVFWILCFGVFAVILWWKGSLMVEYHKHYEVLGWAVLTGVIWTIIRSADILPVRIHAVTRRQMLRGLLFGMSLFFLVIGAMDPFLQLGVQQLSWSSGLAIELGFFIPAGIILMILSQRLSNA